MSKKVNIAIFASGAGSNAEKIMAHFKDSPVAAIGLVVSSKKEAGVLTFADQYKIPTFLLSRDIFQEDAFVHYLKEQKIDLIILAGFLWKVPASLVDAFPEKIINIHPALLPDYGGKGMYGHFVHEAVIGSGAKESGITIHLVDQHYDHGKHLLQMSCPIAVGDTADMLAAKIHQLEHHWFAKTIQTYITDNPGLFDPEASKEKPTMDL